jgi:D-alanyl-D-alanine carboxypeptidase
VGGDGQALTPAELAAQVAAANELRAKLAISNSALAAVITKLDELAKQSNQLLDKLAQAQAVEDSAQTAAKDSEDLSARLTVQLAAEKQRLRAWAFYAYSEGGSAADLVGVFDAMGTDPARAGNPMGDLSYLTDIRAQTFANIQTLQLQQADATYQAEVARTSAEQASADVASAKKAVDAVVAQQQAQLDTLRTTQAAHIAKAGPLVSILAGARTPAAIAAYDALLAEMTKTGQSIGTIGALCSKDEGTYPNGMLPAAALCPLWKAPGESLRPRAAAAFNSLSARYAKQTGQPLCVTDSYRSLGQQYAVKASRGMWAATPGTSPHGLGIALDLCGGINSFGTPAYEWMQQNGPLYGWYHPAWAEPGGSLPEPWHWQFAG